MKATIDPNEIPRTRYWRGQPLSPVTEVMMFLDKTGPAQETFRRLRANLEREGIEYVVIGAFGLAAHRCERAAQDVDLVVRQVDLERFRKTLLGREYQNVEGRPRRFYDPQTQVTFDLLIAGALAGHTEAADINGIRTVSLERLIALKLVTWRYKDWGDVVELIRVNKLEESFAEQPPAFIRSVYMQCYDQMAEEERYEQEHGGH